MNDNFKCIYKILRVLEAALDCEKTDVSELEPERFNISRNRWEHYIEMMTDMGLIKGVTVRQYSDGGKRLICDDIRITLAGLEYLSENTIMQRFYNAAKEAVNFIPGM